MSALLHLGKVSRAYEMAANEYQDIALLAAAAEAEHKSTRAKAILRHKAGEERMSQAEAETRADADDQVAELYMRRLTTAAIADSHREKLKQLREQVATGRTAVASERAADDFHARGLTGAA